MNCTRLNDPPSTAAVVLIVSVFARPGTPSISRWPPGEQADEHPLEHPLLTRDHPPDLEQRLLELLAHVCHVSPPGSWFVSPEGCTGLRCRSTKITG